jgi:hypothetical protein
MSGESSVSVDFEVLEKSLSLVINRAQSLAEIEAWLKSQPGVEAVELTDYLLKSNPPQREFVLEFRAEDGAAVRKIVNIFDLGDRGFLFHNIREQ